MAQKIFDIAAKTGEYQDRQTGQMKGRWQNVGSVMQGDDGTQFIILNRWFNPAGMPNPENRDSTILSCFPPDRQGQGQQPGYGNQYGGGYQQPPQQPPQQGGMPPQGQPQGGYQQPPQQGGVPPQGQPHPHGGQYNPGFRGA